jgi:hypothetical protein
MTVKVHEARLGARASKPLPTARAGQGRIILVRISLKF